MLDAHLARQPFMAGDTLTMADIPIACEMHRWWGLPLERTRRARTCAAGTKACGAARRPRRPRRSPELTHAPTPFKQVDVFTAVPYRGNPLAVVLDGEGLSTEEMQHFTNWTNLSEATFLLPPTQPGADYRVRIFCPGASCRSPAIPRWAAATPGWKPAASRAASTWCRNAASAW
jgi:hypothetical protein